MDERMAEEMINWKIMERLVQGLFVLCFKEANVQTLKRDNVIKKLVDTLVRALEFRQVDLVIQVIKVLTFFSNDEVAWSQIICRDTIKACLMALQTKSRLEKKFILALLCDIC